MVRRFLGVLVIGATLLLTAEGCVTAGGGHLYVRTGPPRPQVERRLVAPGPDFVWQPGFYQWEGREYVWVPGRYERAPRARARWVAGRWAHDRQGWYFIDGHWR